MRTSLTQTVLPVCVAVVLTLLVSGALDGGSRYLVGPVVPLGAAGRAGFVTRVSAAPPVAGTVTVVAPTATVTNGVVTYAVQIALDAQQAQAAGVRAGMTASAAIVTASRERVVLVPKREITTKGQTKTVQVLDASGATTTRQVATGLSGDQSSEITSGLQPGEKVVIPTTTTASTTLGGPGGPPVMGGPPR